MSESQCCTRQEVRCRGFFCGFSYGFSCGFHGNLGRLPNFPTLQCSYLPGLIIELLCWTNMSQARHYLLLHPADTSYWTSSQWHFSFPSVQGTVLGDSVRPTKVLDDRRGLFSQEISWFHTGGPLVPWLGLLLFVLIDGARNVSINVMEISSSFSKVISFWKE